MLARLLVAVLALVVLFLVPSVEALNGFQEFDINAVPGRGFQKPDQIPGFNPTGDGGAIHSASGCHVTNSASDWMIALSADRRMIPELSVHACRTADGAVTSMTNAEESEYMVCGP